MQCKYIWVIIIVIQFLSVFEVKGQGKDTILLPRSIQDKRKLQVQPTQSPLQLLMPELSSGDNDLRNIFVDRKVATFNFKQKLNYPDSLSCDSSFLFLPMYPGLGDYQNFGGTLGSFNLTNKLDLDYGAFIRAQYGYLFSSKQIVFGSNFLLQYKITTKLQFQTWGQYVTPGNSSDPTFNMRSFFSTTNFGAGLQYDSNEKTKIKVGVEYQFDQSDKIWKPESGGKVLMKF